MKTDVIITYQFNGRLIGRTDRHNKSFRFRIDYDKVMLVESLEVCGSKEWIEIENTPEHHTVDLTINWLISYFDIFMKLCK